MDPVGRHGAPSVGSARAGLGVSGLDPGVVLAFGFMARFAPLSFADVSLRCLAVLVYSVRG